MNTKLLMLGILLIAGLSFAADPPSNWMTYLTKSYGCNFYDVQGFPPTAPYEDTRWDIASNYFDNGDCFNYDAMADYSESMAEALWGRPGHWGMCQNSGCSSSEPSTTAFRGNLLEYNAAAMGFNRLFLAGVRECLTEPEYSEHDYDRAEVLSMLSDQREAYSMCLAMARVCYGCGG